MRSFSHQKLNSNFIVVKIGGGENRDFAQLLSMRSIHETPEIKRFDLMSRGFNIMLNGNKTIDFAQLTPSVSEVNHKIHLTKSTTPTKMTAPRNIEGGRGNPLPKGDNNSPQLKAVFLCLSFFNLVEFDPIKLNIMMVLFGQPLWLVVPLGGISTPFNTVTNTVESICDGFILQTKGTTA